ncbi:winged helix-turn-helix domain-containing protein [Paenibacillus aquistagni]|uniref:winged helix-turn-helix domain-containing protein n=1 Tax=Paenibacillus aquistagni TaxID=1852522 RepID=UPI000B50CFC2|nr:winged helix-turn-helix domain-containing protein [Paenibacillus aquistagni]
MALQVRIDCSPVYELISSYMLFVHRKWIRNVDLGTGWVEQVEQSMPEAFIKTAETLKKTSMHIFDLLYAAALERKHPHDIPQFLAQLEEMKEADWKGLLRSYGQPYRQKHVQMIKDIFVPALTLWNERYLQPSSIYWEQPILEDANEKLKLMYKMNPIELIEVATNGVVFNHPDPSHEVVLAPFWHYRPINMTCAFKNTTLILYAAHDPESDEDGPPLSLTRMLSAISNEVRLQILRAIAEEPITFSQLTAHLKLGKNAAKHHLAILRAAGYIQTYWNGEVEKIALRQEGLSDLSVFLENYVRP